MTGWSVAAVAIGLLAVLALWKSKGDRAALLRTGAIFAVPLVIQELIPATRGFAGAAGMGFIGPVPVVMMVVFFGGGILFHYVMNWIISGPDRLDLIRALFAGAVGNLIIMGASGMGSIFYSVAVVGAIGFIRTPYKVRLGVVAAALFAGGLVFESVKYGTLLQEPVAPILAACGLCLGLVLPGGGGGE